MNETKAYEIQTVEKAMATKKEGVPTRIERLQKVTRSYGIDTVT